MGLPLDDDDLVQSRLSRISTIWTMFASAHEGSATETAAARLAFVRRYQRAAYRYLLAAVRDPDAAEELFQDVVLRFVRGDFQGADPDKGRFRDYLKTALSHLATDYHRRRQRQPESLDPTAAQLPDTHAELPDLDATFRSTWRNELLDHAWESLERDEQKGGPPLYSVLRCRAENPDLTSSDIAMQLTVDNNLEPGLTADNVRKMLQRARQQYADHLLDEVENSLQQPDLSELEQELIDFDLLRFCRGALLRRS